MKNKIRINKSELHAGSWPTTEQELLVRACLLSDQQARAALAEWKDCVDLSHLDAGSRRLLPLLHHNLRGYGIRASFLRVLQDECQNTWCQNQLLFYSLARLVRAFNQEGIANLLLKGSALSLLYYKDVSLRPMSDIDLLVRLDRAQPSIELVTRLGWKSKYSSPTAHVLFEHATEFYNAENQSLDLHWRALEEGNQDVGDEDFWSGAISTELNGASTYSLNPADQLLHVCVHGMQWNSTPHLRWIADAMMIIRSPDCDVDWERLVRQARERGLTMQMKDSLGYLRRLLDARVPNEVMHSLAIAPTTKPDQAYYVIRRLPNEACRSFAIFLSWIVVLRRHHQETLFARAILFLRYLQSLWKLEHLWQVPFHAAVRSVRRIFQLLLLPLARKNTDSTEVVGPCG